MPPVQCVFPVFALALPSPRLYALQDVVRFYAVGLLVCEDAAITRNYM